MQFDLLNPGEVFNIGLTVIDGLDEPVTFIARAEYLEVRQIGDRAETDELIEVLLSSVPYWGNIVLDLVHTYGLNNIPL